jgi:hypothetical protein
MEVVTTMTNFVTSSQIMSDWAKTLKIMMKLTGWSSNNEPISSQTNHSNSSRQEPMTKANRRHRTTMLSSQNNLKKRKQGSGPTCNHVYKQNILCIIVIFKPFTPTPPQCHVGLAARRQPSLNVTLAQSHGCCPGRQPSHKRAQSHGHCPGRQTGHTLLVQAALAMLAQLKFIRVQKCNVILKSQSLTLSFRKL